MAKDHTDGCVSVDELRKRYSGVILAYGALKDRHLGLDGELSVNGILPSRRIVNWYNGSLDNDLTLAEFDPSKTKDVIVVGNGNIFCDIARTLLKNPKEFESTDMPQSTIELLKQSNIENIQSVARRGINQAAFTTKEIREVSGVDDLQVYMIKDEVQRSMEDAALFEEDVKMNYSRAVARRTEFLLHTFRAI